MKVTDKIIYRICKLLISIFKKSQNEKTIISMCLHLRKVEANQLERHL